MTTRRFAITAAPLIALAGLTACGSDTPAEQTPAPTDGSMVDDSTVDDMADDSMVDDMTDDSMVDDMTDDSMVDDMTDDSMSDTESMTDDTAPSTDDMTDVAAFQTLAITDVDGSTFSLGDLAGTPVMVETFATWCSKCRAQLGTTQDAAAAAGDDAVVLALSVETDLDASDVARYAADNGFTDIRFAVATPEMLAALVDQFGNTIAVPPSTPKFYIDEMGHAGELITGAESTDDILAALGLTG